MYDMKPVLTNGIILVLFFLISAIILLIESGFWRKERTTKEKKFDMVLGWLAVIISIGMIVRYLLILINPQILIQEGEFLREKRDATSLFRHAYIFDTEKEESESFYLDIFSNDDICPEDLNIGEIYKIHFEKKTKIIVKVEKLD